MDILHISESWRNYMNHSTYVNHSSSIWNCNTNFFVMGEGRKGDSQGRLKRREGKEGEWSCVQFEFTFFSTVLKMFEGFMIKFVTFNLPVQPAESFPGFPAIWRFNVFML